MEEKLEQASVVLDGLPSGTVAAVTADAARGDGISAEQTLRAIVIQRMTGWGYGDLAFRVQGSAMLRRFCRLGPGDAFSEAMLEQAIQRITLPTMERVTRHLVAHGL